MSTKKRFSIAPDLASGLRNTIQTASTNQGQLHYDMMAIDAIEPDPNNPRKLLITREEILNGLSSSDSNYKEKEKEYEALKELSESIKRVGIRNAIEVYKDGLTYRIISGERRYWAAQIAGQKTVPTRICQKPDEFNLRYTQWVENINRQDLSLWEKYNNLLLIADAYTKTHQSEFDEEVLKKILGISNIQTYRYFCLLKAEEKLVSLIQQGKINNLKLIQELVAMKDKGARNQILSWIENSKEEVTSLANYRVVAGKKTPSLSIKTGSSITLGKTNNSLIVKELFEIVLSDERLNKYRQSFNKIDWASPKSISKSFKDLLKAMEKELSCEEMG